MGHRILRIIMRCIQVGCRCLHVRIFRFAVFAVARRFAVLLLRFARQDMGIAFGSGAADFF